jgi:hypothetical protein
MACRASNTASTLSAIPWAARTAQGRFATLAFDILNREILTNWSNEAPEITRSFDDASLSKKTWPVVGIIPPHWEEVGIYVVD